MASSIPRSFIKVPLQNGVGRHVVQLQRLVIRFCKSNGVSRGTRDFIEKYLLDFTRANPGIVIYLKPRRHREPALTASYLNGETKTINVSNKSSDEICQWMTFLRDQAGYPNHRLIRRWHTETPSIQGIWTPYLNKDPRMNVLNFPSDLPEFKFKPHSQTATELILQKARELSLKDKEEGTSID